MDRTIAVGIIAVFFISITFILWVTGTNVFYDPDDGLVAQLDEQAEKDMNTDYYNRWTEQKSNTETAWGLTGVLIIGVLIFIIIIIAFRHRKRADQQ